MRTCAPWQDVRLVACRLPQLQGLTLVPHFMSKQTPSHKQLSIPMYVCVCVCVSHSCRVQGVKEIMQDARAKLAERGERLHKMDEDSQALENEAAGFAELAKQLAEKEKNRKWWQ